jgi:hypothetical protein
MRVGHCAIVVVDAADGVTTVRAGGGLLVVPAKRAVIGPGALGSWNKQNKTSSRLFFITNKACWGRVSFSSLHSRFTIHASGTLGSSNIQNKKVQDYTFHSFCTYFSTCILIVYHVRVSWAAVKFRIEKSRLVFITHPKVC